MTGHFLTGWYLVYRATEERKERLDEFDEVTRNARVIFRDSRAN
jgi:hypothetical protein